MSGGVPLPDMGVNCFIRFNRCPINVINLIYNVLKLHLSFPKNRVLEVTNAVFPSARKYHNDEALLAAALTGFLSSTVSLVVGCSW